VIRRLAQIIALSLFASLLGADPALAAPAGTTFATTTVVVDGITTGTVKLTTLSVLGFPSYATRAKVKNGAYFDLVPNTGFAADNVSIVNAPDGRQWTIVSSGGSTPVFGPSGASHSTGLVPDPGAVAGSTKFLREDATWQSVPGGGDALTANPLSQFASTTSLQLKGVMSDETGSGALVFGTSPTITTPTVSGDLTMSGGNIYLHSTGSDLYRVRNLEYFTEKNNGNKTGAAQALADWGADGSVQRITLTGNVSSSSWSLPTVGPTFFQLKVIQDGTGGRTLVWPSSSPPVWIGGVTPVLSTAASAVDLFQFYWDGTTVYGWQIKNAVSTVTASAPLSSSGGFSPNITLGTVGIANGGTGQTTAAAAHDALTVKSSDVASASTTDLCAAGIGIFTHVTGTATIGGLGTCAAGVERIVEFTGAATVTHNATSLINLTGSDRKTAAGDMAVYVSEGSGNWREVNYAYVQPDPLGEHDDGNSGTSQTIDFSKWRIHKSTLTGNVTYTFTAPARASNVVLHLVEDGTGGRTITLPASVKWTGGTTPTWVTTANAHNVIACYTDATNYYCSAYTQ